MAIKRDKKDSGPQIPEILDNMLLKGFTEQFMKSHYEEAFKATKGEVEVYLEHNKDGFDAKKGEGFKCKYGSVIYTGRQNLNIDKDKILELVDKGELTLAQVLASVSTWKTDELKGTLANHYDDIVEVKETEYLTFKANSEFKTKCESELSVDEPLDVASLSVPDAIVVKVDKKQVAKAAAENRAKKESPANVDDDLDAILAKKPTSKPTAVERAKAAKDRAKNR